MRRSLYLRFLLFKLLRRLRLGSLHGKLLLARRPLKLRLQARELLTRRRPLLPHHQLTLLNLGVKLCLQARELLTRRRALLLHGELVLLGGLLQLCLKTRELCLHLRHATVCLATLLLTRGLFLCLMKMPRLGQPRLEVVRKELIAQLPGKVFDLRRVHLDDLATLGAGNACHTASSNELTRAWHYSASRRHNYE